LIDLLASFGRALREANIPVSQSELNDAAEALTVVPVEDRESFRDALMATMIKDPAHREVFLRLFELFFPERSLLRSGDSQALTRDVLFDEDSETDEELREAVFQALRDQEYELLDQLIRRAVRRFGGLESGRAVSGVYYTYRTLRQLDTDAMLQALIGGDGEEDGEGAGDDPLAQRLRFDAAQRRLTKLKASVSAEVTRHLVADRGAEAVARTLALSLPEDIDIVHASREELARLQGAMNPLAHKLASRLARRHRSHRETALDLRRTMRSALSSGGVPIDLVFRPPKKSKPEIMLLADISGSVASFARFTMQLVFAMATQFSKIRTFAFIDSVDEVTEFFGDGREINEALRLVNTKAKVVWLDGHSDYGHALGGFEERFGGDVTKRTSIIICGDARNNYHEAKVEALSSLRVRAKHVYWLNPEPYSYWDTGDSVIGRYASACDGVFECRTLRQLEEFVGQVL
jgi:uncharacterized protein with von Willebrand factor type A (vWA) domain